MRKTMEITLYKIKLRMESVYGTERFYPDCPISDLLTTARCTKCLCKKAIEALARKVPIEYTAFENSEFLDSLGAKKV